MQIFYCEGCGLRISNDDLSADTVIKQDDKWYCQKCATAKGIKPPTKGSNTRLEAIRKPPSTPDRGQRAPASGATPASANSAVAVRSKRRAEQTGKNAMTIGIVVFGAGVLLFVVSLMVFASRPKDSAVASNSGDTKPAVKPEEPHSTPAQPSPAANPVLNPVKTDESKAPSGHFLETPKSDPVTKPVATPNVLPKTETPAQTTPTKAENTSNGNWESLPFDLQSGQVLSAAFSPDGKWLLCGCLDHSMMLIDLETRKPQKITTGHTERVASVAFSPNGKMFASGSWDRTAKIWDMETRTCKFTLSGHTHWIWSAVFSPDSATLATGSFDKSTRYWNTATGEGRRFDTHVSEVLSLDCAPTGTLLLAAGTGMTVRVWDFSNDTEKCNFRVSGVAHGAAFSPDGKLIGVGFEADKSVGVWDMNGKLQCMLHGHTNFIHSVCFLDNKTIVSCGRDKLIKVWDIPGSKEIATLRGHTDVVNAVAYCPQRKILLSVSNDGKIRFWTNAAFFDGLGK